MDREELNVEEQEASLTNALEDLEEVQSTVEALQDFVRKEEEEDEEKQGEGEEEEEQVAEKKIWSKEKAEAQAKTERYENEYAKGEKTNEAVIKGVKGVVANAHESKQNEKQGQQKWGMFETHYQREKHITLEESLTEIERYSKYGELPKEGYKAKMKEAGNSEVRKKLELNFQKDKMKGRKPGVAPVGNPKKLGEEVLESDGQDGESKKGGEEGTGVTDKIEPKKNENKAVKKFASNLKKGGNEGTKFFEQYQKREKKKFQPTFGMKDYY